MDRTRCDVGLFIYTCDSCGDEIDSFTSHWSVRNHPANEEADFCSLDCVASWLAEAQEEAERRTS